MSNHETIYLAPECHEQGERLWCADNVWGSCHEHDGEHCEIAHPSVRYVRGDLHDALAQRCASLEAASVMPGFLANPMIDTLRAEVERLRALMAECAEYLNINNLTSIGHGSILHRKMIDAAMESQACANTAGSSRET